MKINKYYLAAIGAFLIWGFFPIAIKALDSHPSGQILYFRIIISGISLIIFSIAFRRKYLAISVQVFKESPYTEKKRFLLLTVGGGLLLTTNWLTFIFTINHISIQTGSFSYLICPIITAILGFIILKESLSVNKWIAIALSGVSCALLGSGSFLNLGFSLLIASSYAFYLITQRALRAYDKIFLLSLQLLVAIVIVGPFYSFFNGDASVDMYFFGVILLISVLFTILPLLLSLFALKEMASGTMGILMYLNPLLNFVIAFLYFNEQATATQLSAYLVISLSLILYNIRFSNKAGWLQGSTFKFHKSTE